MAVNGLYEVCDICYVIDILYYTIIDDIAGELV